MDYLRAQLQQAGQNEIDPTQLDRLAEIYINVNPQEPLYVQYLDYISSTARGDLGFSIWYNEPVIEILAHALPWTVYLMLTATLIMFFGGITIGAVMAYFEGSRFDVVTTIVMITTNSVPYYVLAIVLLFLFGYQLNWFPVSGRMASGTTVGLNWPFFAGVFHHSFLPIISLIITGIGGWALAMRGNGIRVLGEDYIRVARLRGIDDKIVATRYVGRNAILPLYTNLMISLGFVFGGAVVLEEIFVYRGVGYYLFRGVLSRDYPLMMGAFILITVAVIAGIFFAEITYGKLDPRASEEGDQHETY